MQRSTHNHALRLTTSLCLAAVFLLSGAAMAQYQVIGTVSSDAGAGVERTEITVQAGPSPLDAFKITRLVRPHVPTSHLRGTILFLPSLGIDFTSYEQTTPREDLGSSIAGYFAVRNFDVFGYSSRIEGIPAGTCEAGVLDCSVMQGWNLQTVVDDVAFVRAQIEALHPGAEVFVGGLSLGGISTIAVLDAHPGDYAGAFIWEGMLASPDPQVQALNQAYCDALEAQLAAGILYDGVGGSVLKKATTLADVNPDGLTPIPLFPPVFTNHQVLVALFSEVTPGPVSMPVPNYILVAGDLAQDRLFFADEARLTDNVRRFNDYVPTATVRDVSCSLSGEETRYVDGLGAFTGPVLAIGGGRGFGPYMSGTLDLLGSTDVEILLEPAFGHADHLLVADHRRYVEEPIRRWILWHSR